MWTLLVSISVFWAAVNCSPKYSGIRDLNLRQCDSFTNMVSLQNFQVISFDENKINMTGRLINQLNLQPPIQVSLSIHRKVYGVWIPLPCIEDYGSCTYDDVCEFGYPPDKLCPSPDAVDEIPCRCPIDKGNYSLPTHAELLIPKAVNFLKDGSYKGTVIAHQDNKKISCYIFSFTLF